MQSTSDEERQRRFGSALGLRSRTARGTIVNTAFLVFINMLGILKGLVVTALVTPREYGVWGVLSITFVTVLSLKQVGVSDKFVQQSERDEKAAFQKAFTFELAVTAAMTLVTLAAIPILTQVYGEDELLAPGLVVVLAVPPLALQAPIWLFYRRMQFVRQRVLQGVEPLVSFAVTIVLAAAGLGYWSLVVGLVCGGWAAALTAIWASPYPLRLRWDPGALSDYVSFSWPIFVGVASGLAISQGSILLGDVALGLAGVGAMVLAHTISIYVWRLNDMVTQTLYPAICAVRDRADLLEETFVKSNQLLLLAAAPFAAGLALFASDLIQFGIGEKWRPAEDLLRATALMVLMGQIGFNWRAFFQARAETRPIAVASFAMLVAVATVAFPLLLLEGLDAYALGMVFAAAVLLAFRVGYLRRLFPLRVMARMTASGLAPVAAATAVVLGVRLLVSGDRELGEALVELTLFMLVALVAALASQRGLVREVLAYVRQPRPDLRPAA